MRLFVIPVLVTSLVAQQPPARSRQFFSGYAGSLPSRDVDKARTFFDRPAVRGLLARLEGGSLSREAVESTLQGSGTSLSDLLHVRLIRPDGDRYAIGFAYFTADDMRRIYAVADRAAPSLAAAYRARKSEFDRIFSRYPVSTVPRDRIAFVLISGFCLNWDGLEVTRELGYRRPVWVEGDGYRYSFWASETVAQRDYREVYWGSSTFPPQPAEYAFSSFGDPDSDPRMNMPDLLFMPPKEMAPAVGAAAGRVGVHDEDAFGMHFEQVLGSSVATKVSAVLFALREKPQTSAQLEAEAEDSTQALLALLTEVQYVSADGRGVYHLTVPVFDRGDKGLVTDTIALSRAIMRSWLRQHLPEMKRELSGLTAVANGLPFEAVFTQIWHEIFGQVTRDLAQSGVTASAYGQDVRYKGSLSVLWRPVLYSFIPG